MKLVLISSRISMEMNEKLLGGVGRRMHPQHPAGFVMNVSRAGIMKRGADLGGSETKLRLANGLGGLPLARFVDLERRRDGIDTSDSGADLLAQLFDSFRLCG